MMSLLIVSDLHIWGPDDPLYVSLLNLLRHRAQDGDVIVLAGDLFDVWVGNKKIFRDRYWEFFDALKVCSLRGMKIRYIEGNHDFLMRRCFDEIQGISLHEMEFQCEIEGKRFYFAHGDQVDRSDYGYRFLRAFFRSPIMKLFVSVTPGSWLMKIGETSSQRSRKAKPIQASQLPLKRMEFLRKTYRSFAAEKLAEGFDFVVMGHCHDLDEMHFNIGGRKGQYVNVGFPRVHGSFLSWSPGEEKIHRERLPG